jgi:hypothetical protein
MISLCRPSAKNPGRTLLRKLLDEQYDKARLAIKNSLPKKGRVSLAIDCWNSPNTYAFLGIAAYWVTEQMEYRETLIAFKVLHGSHTGELLAKIIHETLQSYNITDRFLAVTCDNAGNNDTMRFELAGLLSRYNNISWDHQVGGIRCLAHVIQLSVKEFMRSLKAAADNNKVDPVLTNSRLDAISTSISIPNTFSKVR